jgi:hypothetical protein
MSKDASDDRPLATIWFAPHQDGPDIHQDVVVDQDGEEDTPPREKRVNYSHANTVNRSRQYSSISLYRKVVDFFELHERVDGGGGYGVLERRG